MSVVVPTHNRRALLHRTLAGILAQQDVCVEVIVVDDASEDDTPDYLAAITDLRVRSVRHRTSLGVAAARNAGLARSSAPWVAFTDDDDLWAPTKLARQLQQLRWDSPALWSCTGAAVVDDDLTIHRLHAPPDPIGLVDLLLEHNGIPGGGSGVVAQTALLRSIGGFDIELENLADWDLWIRLALAAPMAPVADPLIASVVHSTASSLNVTGSTDELALLRVKHAAESRARGVAVGGWASGRYEAESHLRAGRRLPAAAAELRNGARHGRARSIPWAVLALWSPTSLERRDLRKLGRSDDPAVATANRWLASFRTPGPIEARMPVPAIRDALERTRPTAPIGPRSPAADRAT